MLELFSTMQPGREKLCTYYDENGGAIFRWNSSFLLNLAEGKTDHELQVEKQNANYDRKGEISTGNIK
jgi:hypothetical protein